MGTMGFLSSTDKLDADEIRNRLDYRSFYEREYGPLGSIDSNSEAHVLCCFHNDTDPSLSINIHKGLFHCFGCGQSGNPYQFYMKRHGVDFTEALQKVAEFAGVAKSQIKKKEFKEVGQDSCPEWHGQSLDSVRGYDVAWCYPIENEHYRELVEKEVVRYFGVAKSIRLVGLPGPFPKDVIGHEDVLAAWYKLKGADAESELNELVKRTPIWEPRKSRVHESHDQKSESNHDHDERESPHDDHEQESPFKETCFTRIPLNQIKAGRFFESLPADIEWLIKDSFPASTLGFLCAKGGVGKGYLNLQLAVAVAGQLPFLNDHYAIGKHGKVFVILGEDSEAIVHYRLHHIVEALLKNFDKSKRGEILERLDNNLYVQSVFGLDSRLTQYDYRNLKETKAYDQLLKRLQGIKDLRLVVFDPISRFSVDEENDSSSRQYLATLLEKVVATTSANLLSAHHPHKGTGKGVNALYAEAMRGSNALTNAGRWQMNLAPIDTLDCKKLGINPEQENQYVIGQVTKKNIGKPEMPFYLKRDDHGVLHHVPVEIKIFDHDRTIMDHVVKKIGELEGQGIRMTKREFCRTFASVWHGYGRTKLERTIALAVVAGALSLIYERSEKGRAKHVLAIGRPTCEN